MNRDSYSRTDQNGETGLLFADRRSILYLFLTFMFANMSIISKINIKIPKIKGKAYIYLILKKSYNISKIWKVEIDMVKRVKRKLWNKVKMWWYI